MGAIIEGRTSGCLVLIFSTGAEGVDGLADLDSMLHCHMNLSEPNV